jgi:hypothetical protein
MTVCGEKNLVFFGFFGCVVGDWGGAGAIDKGLLMIDYC